MRIAVGGNPICSTTGWYSACSPRRRANRRASIKAARRPARRRLPPKRRCRNSIAATCRPTSCPAAALGKPAWRSAAGCLPQCRPRRAAPVQAADRYAPAADARFPAPARSTRARRSRSARYSCRSRPWVHSAAALRPVATKPPWPTLSSLRRYLERNAVGDALGRSRRQFAHDSDFVARAYFGLNGAAPLTVVLLPGSAARRADVDRS